MHKFISIAAVSCTLQLLYIVLSNKNGLRKKI